MNNLKITKYDDGYKEEWFDEDGKLHKEDKPSFIFYDKDGEFMKYYYFHGKPIHAKDDEDFKKIVKHLILK